ncbi:hypothetical protein RB597_000022 [Gaeumannomyces tritici]
MKSRLFVRTQPSRPISPGGDRRPSPPAVPSSPPDSTGSAGSSAGPAGAHEIVFPKVFEEAWGTGSLDGRTDLERARIFLMRFATISAGNRALATDLRAIAADQACRCIPDLAAAVQAQFFGARHDGFATTPLMQAVRFLLIKGHVPEAVAGQVHGHVPVPVLADRAQAAALLDFFFDPVLARSLDPPPPDGVRYRYPAARLKVAIVGGGPTALASAISLAEKGAGRVEVHVWERRWVQTTAPDGVSPWFGYPPTARRRDQVVTLQESVTRLLSPGSLQALFEGRPEAVWPGSANIQIRKVEDRFLRRCQSHEFRGLIHLHAETATRESLASGRLGDFHVLLGADGAASWVRKSYFHGVEHERGRSYALGLAFDRPAGLPWSQPLNVFLTLGQTRYLLNASDHDGRGYLNMQLTEDEWHRMVGLDGEPVTFGHPGCLRRKDGSIPDGFTEGQVFAPAEDRESPLWKSIEDGLKLFGFKEGEVINVVRIPIVVQAVKEGVQMLPPAEAPSIRRPHALVAVAGDAAMTVHFWPGRGLNSGIKSGIALGDEIVASLNDGRFVGLSPSAMDEYNAFIMKLQDREHDKRSIPILNQSGSPEMLGWLLSKAGSVPDEVAVEWLVGAMAQIAARLEARPDWAFAPVANVEPQLRIVLRQLHPLTLREMAVSFPWPTREMGGAEVLPVRSMRPEEKQRWVASLWNMLRDERKKERAGVDAEVRAARFEAPRQPRGGSLLPPPPPSPGQHPPRSPTPPEGTPLLRRGSADASPPERAGTLRRSNATKAGGGSVRGHGQRQQDLGVPGLGGAPRRHSRSASSVSSLSDFGLAVPGPESQASSLRSPSPGPAPSGDMQLGRLLSVHRRPQGTMLTDALSLALFRVDATD